MKLRGLIANFKETNIIFFTGINLDFTFWDICGQFVSDSEYM